MTKAIKPTRRETFTSVRERGQSRPIVITLNATHITIKLKGMRHAYTVTYSQVWTIGAKNAANQLREAKAKAREAKKGQS